MKYLLAATLLGAGLLLTACETTVLERSRGSDSSYGYRDRTENYGDNGRYNDRVYEQRDNDPRPRRQDNETNVRETNISETNVTNVTNNTTNRTNRPKNDSRTSNASNRRPSPQQAAPPAKTGKPKNKKGNGTNNDGPPNRQN